MARVVVYSMAYRGDVYPYVPIASALARRGHDVTFVVPDEFHPQFAAEPFRCVSSGTDFGPTALDEHADFVDTWGNRMGGARLLSLYFGTFTIPHLDALYGAIEAEVAGADVLVSHPAASMVGAMAAEVHGVPFVVGDLFPMLLPTEFAPMAGMPYLGRRVSRTVGKVVRSKAVDPLTFGKPFRDYRTRLGLSNDGWNVLDGRVAGAANLGLVPAAYVEARPDWPEGYRLVGFTPWDGPEGGALDDEVEAFLDAGEPPVVVTLGTSAASARPEVFDRALDALDAAGARSIVLASSAALAARVAPRAGDRHLVRPFVPLRPLLDRARAMVHSGAHGTNALALLAGVPSVVVPCIFDQVWHARRQQELGTGVWVRKGRDLGPALTRVLHDDGYATRSRAFAAQIGEDDGTQATVDAVESLLSH